MEAVAKWDVDANSNTLLSFQKGDILKIMDKEDDDPVWFKAELNGTSGLVSENMIDIRPNPWYFGKAYCKSTEAEAILSQQPSKIFLIRKSRNKGLFLSYKRLNGDKVWHFKISKSAQGTFSFFSDQKGQREFFSLNELADFVKSCAWYTSPWWSPNLEELAFKPRSLSVSYNRN